MQVNFAKMETTSQKLFKEFLDGRYLPSASCDLVIRDLVDLPKGKLDYLKIVEVVKAKLDFSNVSIVDNVMFVNFEYRYPEIERPVIVRMLNLVHGGTRTIVLNETELVYMPHGMRSNHTTAELEAWLDAVHDKHTKLSLVKKQKEVISKIASKFDLVGFFSKAWSSVKTKKNVPSLKHNTDEVDFSDVDFGVDPNEPLVGSPVDKS